MCTFMDITLNGTVTSGIPQGAVLGPILFVIFINDFLECVQSEVDLFVDDTKLFSAIRMKPYNMT